MLIYEKENKLNINFDNEVSEQPDLQISKEDGKTSVKIDGQESGGGSGGGAFIVHDNSGTLDKTWEEIYNAMDAGNISVIKANVDESAQFQFISSARMADSVHGDTVFRVGLVGNKNTYETDSRSGYPVNTQ